MAYKLETIKTDIKINLICQKSFIFIKKFSVIITLSIILTMVSILFFLDAKNTRSNISILNSEINNINLVNSKLSTKIEEIQSEIELKNEEIKALNTTLAQKTRQIEEKQDEVNVVQSQKERVDGEKKQLEIEKTEIIGALVERTVAGCVFAYVNLNSGSYKCTVGSQMIYCSAGRDVHTCNFIGETFVCGVTYKGVSSCN